MHLPLVSGNLPRKSRSTGLLRRAPNLVYGSESEHAVQMARSPAESLRPQTGQMRGKTMLDTDLNVSASIRRKTAMLLIRNFTLKTFANYLGFETTSHCEPYEALIFFIVSHIGERSCLLMQNL